MHFLTVEQAQSEPFSSEYRYRIMTTLSALLLCFAIAVASTIGAYGSWVEGTWMGVVILSWIALWFLFFAWILRGVLRARRRPTNWLVRTQSNGILIKFRSPLNYHFEPHTLGVVHIPYGDVEFARPHRIRQRLPGHEPSEDVTTFVKFAELKMRDERPLGELEAKLSEERNRQGPIEGRFIKSRGKSRHYPLHVSSDGFVRIEWFVRPSLARFMSDIAGRVAVKETVGSRKDFRNLQDVSQQEQETALLELIASGERMSALHAIRRLYGYDTTRAVQFLEELSQIKKK